MSLTDLEHGVDAAVEGVHEEHGDEEQLLHAVGVQTHHGLDHEVAHHHPHRAGQQPHPQPNLWIDVELKILKYIYLLMCRQCDCQPYRKYL